MKTFPRINNAIHSAPWAIEPRALEMISAIVERHMAGEPVPQVDKKPIQQSAEGVAVINIIGPIIPRANMMSDLSGATSSEAIADAVFEAANDDAIETILYNIDSPGGSVIGAFETADIMFAARGKKKTMASINGVGASLAYLYAAQADEIYASRGSIVGSIGVIARIANADRAARNEGVDFITVASSREKAGSGLTQEEQMANLQAEVAQWFGMFKASLAQARPSMSLDEVANGKTWIGEEALSLGLVDGIASFSDLIG